MLDVEEHARVVGRIPIERDGRKAAIAIDAIDAGIEMSEHAIEAQSELIAATIGWPQASVAVEPDPFTLQAVTDSAFSGTVNGMKMLLM